MRFAMEISTSDRAIIVDYLLTRLAVSLDGALDIWTVVCLSQSAEAARVFLDRQVEIVRSLNVVLRTCLSEMPSGNAASHELEDEMSQYCAKLEATFGVLRRHRELSPGQVQEAAQGLLRLHREFQEAIQQVAAVVEIQLFYFRNVSDERREHFDRIRRNLVSLFSERVDCTMPAS